METYRCPTCLCVLADAGARRCPGCHQRLHKRRRSPVVLRADARLQPLPIDRLHARRLETPRPVMPWEIEDANARALAPPPEPVIEAVLVVEPEPRAEPVVVRTPEPVVAPEPQLAVAPEPEPVVARDPEPEPEPALLASTEPEPEPVRDPDSRPARAVSARAVAAAALSRVRAAGTTADTDLDSWLGGIARDARPERMTAAEHEAWVREMWQRRASVATSSSGRKGWFPAFVARRHDPE